MRNGAARKWRTMGRIEHTLLDEGRASSPTDLRPSLATPPYHIKLQMFLSLAEGRKPDKGPGLVGVQIRPGRGGKPQPDYGLSNLTCWPLSVVNGR